MRNPTSVYLYYDAHRVLLYVGITSRGMARQLEHNATKPWWDYVNEQQVEHYETRAEAAHRERLLIDLHRPPFNTQGNPDHESTRATYLAFRATIDPSQTALDIVVQNRKRLTLRWCSVDRGSISMWTVPNEAAVSARLVSWSGAKIRVGGKQCGHVTQVLERGPLQLICATVRQDLNLLSNGSLPPVHATLKITLRPEQAGGPVFGIKGIIVESEATA